MRIVLDPGHGGKDPGAVGHGLQEADINLRLAKCLAVELRSKKHAVIMTRSTDEYLSLAQRSKISNDNNPDLFISLHCNAATNPSAHGIETLCYSLSSKGYIFALAVQKALVEGTGLANRGVKARPDLYVLKHTKAPAILIELGFISNPKDAEWLKNPENIRLAARLIAQAI